MIEFAVIFSPGADLEVDMGQVMEVSTAPPYLGEYEVVPKVYAEQTLPTSGKLLGRDVLVHKIPQFEVSNNSGGKTLIIGEE